MGLNIVLTGFPGTGSSAFFDLLSEYSCNGTGLPEKQLDYEHITFYMPGGLFDLGDKLLIGNDVTRSDEAIYTFKEISQRLNKNDFGWYGSYSAMFGKQFEKITNEFINELSPIKRNTHNYWHRKGVRFSIKKVILQFGALCLLGRKVHKWGREYLYYPKKPESIFVYPTEEEYYTAAKKYVQSYMEMFRNDGHRNVIFDRLLLIHHLFRIPDYFDGNLRTIVVHRDIRDIYIINKYIWPIVNAATLYPLDVKEFISYWKKTNAIIKPVDDKRVLHIYFEDLVYKTEETIKLIEDFCEMSANEHIDAAKYFIPEKSMKNTQVFNLKEEWKEEIKQIEEELSDYIYEFPYPNQTAIEDMFDNSRQEIKHSPWEMTIRKIMDKLGIRGH